MELVKFPGENETGHRAGISWLSSGAAPASSGMWSKSRRRGGRRGERVPGRVLVRQRQLDRSHTP